MVADPNHSIYLILNLSTTPLITLAKTFKWGFLQVGTIYNQWDAFCARVSASKVEAKSVRQFALAEHSRWFAAGGGAVPRGTMADGEDLSVPIADLAQNLETSSRLTRMDLLFRYGVESTSPHVRVFGCALSTGAGKLLPFQVAAIAQPNTAIVVTPLLALMDQVSQCLSKNIAAAALHCEMSEENRDKVIKQVRSKAIKLLYVSPERMARKEFSEKMKLVGVSLLVMDEAHCCIEWGEGFRPIYSMLPVFATKLSPKAILCTTATANPHVSAKLCSQFGIDADCIFKTSIFRQNLYLDCIKTSSSNKRHVLLEQLHKYTSPQSPFNGTGIIYCQRRTDVDNLTKFLKSGGYCAREYHSQIPANKKREVLEWIMEGEVRNRLCGKGDCIPNKLVVATIAFGLGINAAISFVIHYTIPQSPERYLQEVGRAARKEEIKLGSCTTILTDNDYAYTSHLIGVENGYSLSVEGNKALVDSLLSQKSAPPQRLLVQLFREGIIEFTNYQPELWEYKVCRKLDNGELYLFCRKVVEELKEVSLRKKQGLVPNVSGSYLQLFLTLPWMPIVGNVITARRRGPFLPSKKYLT
ncbi:P-loop containing nucleoside triphosphate hydrolase protein [Obelidium mucronatum]|nr:P-loop containing nucleoside triphosphate hydrolase protein [Obelidium mucronatum]